MRFRKINMNYGLSYNSILCVMQDHEQFLWIGTRDGLDKYNSIDNEVFKSGVGDSASLSHSQINCLYETRDSIVWVGSAKGLNKYNRAENNFVRYPSSLDSTGLSNEYIKCISEDANGFLWVGTSYGLNKYNPQTNSFEHITLAHGDVKANNIITLLHDAQGRLWLGTGAGLYLNDKELITGVDFAPDDESTSFEIRDIKQSTNGEIWIGTENHGVYSVEFTNNSKLKSFKVFNTKNSGLISNSVRKILVDDDQVWLATLKGAAIIGSNSQLSNITYSIDHSNGISNSSIHDIIKDHTGGYWLASYTGGLNYYHPQNNLFPHLENVIQVEGRLKSDIVTGFYEDENNDIWIATNSGGLSQWNPSKNTFKHYVSETDGISSNIVKSLAADKDGNLWIGTYDGLNFFNRKTGKFTTYYHKDNDANSLSHNQVHVVYVDEDSFVWIGMNGGEFQVFNPKTQTFSILSGVGKIVNSIFEDSKGRIWIGERNGLRCLNRETRQLIDISEITDKVKERLYYINQITEDSKGRIWISTQSSGLIQINGENEVYLFNESNSLNDNTVNALLEDDEGYYWISTNTGISRLELIEQVRDELSIKSVNFTEVHGLQGKQFEKGSAIRTQSGQLLFGGINGASIVTPKETNKIYYFPSVVLSEVKIHYETEQPSNIKYSSSTQINEIDKLILNYNERNIYIRFAGINFINPSATYYRYRLGNTDKQWIDLDHQRSINFTYLPVGKYELQIKASSDNLVWGTTYKSIEIVVRPPWWKTWWAIVIYSIISFILLYIFFYYAQKWANLKNSLAMEHFKHEQELELHESKLRFFTDVSHDLRTPLTLILSPLERIAKQKNISEELSRQLELIQRNGNRMMNLINQVLNLRKLETGHDRLQAVKSDIVLFLKEISLAFNEVAGSRNIGFNYIHEVEKLMVYFDQDKMESVIYNILSNAFKNTSTDGVVTLKLSIVESEASKLFPKTKSAAKMAEISVSNIGKIIPRKDIEHIFERFYTKQGVDNSGSLSIGVGLELSKRMVQLHRGNISVSSKSESGTEQGTTSFVVRVPLGKRHLSKDELSHNFVNSETPSLYTQNMYLHEKYIPIDSVLSEDKVEQGSKVEKQSLLIVEDNAEVRHFIMDLFKDTYAISEAENGAVGWEKATTLMPDLIISDLMMPEMDGIQLCHKLKTGSRTSHIPVVLLTARTTPAFKYEGIETGADEYITKPFSAEFLKIRVKNLIQKRDLLRGYFMRQSILEPKDMAVTSVDERLLKKAVDYITENIENPSISVEVLSKVIGLSRVHFYRKIKAITNMTAVDFIRSIRLKKAAMLLQKNKLSIKEVQYMVGFESADYFRKRFKAQYELTPSEYIAKFKDHKEKKLT